MLLYIGPSSQLRGMVDEASHVCTRLYACPTSSVESGTTTTTTTTLRMHIVSTILFAQSRAVGPGGTDAYSGGRPTVYLTPAVWYASHPCYAHLERVGQAFYDSYFRDSPESQRHIYDDQDAPTAVVAAPSGPANAAGLIDRAKA